MVLQRKQPTKQKYAEIVLLLRLFLFLSFFLSFFTLSLSFFSLSPYEKGASRQMRFLLNAMVSLSLCTRKTRSFYRLCDDE
jgi:hypothetical protein